MPLVSGSIPNLVNGVSQQPSALRLDSQCEAMVNCYPSVVEGLKQRTPTYHVAKIFSGTLADAFIHTINRDTDERYVVVIRDGSIKVFDLDGNEKTVATPDGVDYLDAALPSASFKCVTIADYTFIVNTTIEVEMDSAASAARPNSTIVYVKQGNYSTTYSVAVSGGAGSVTGTVTTDPTDPDEIKTEFIAEEIRSQIDAHAGYAASRTGSTIHITCAQSFATVASDSNGDRNMVAVTGGTLQRFSDLPTMAPDDFKVEITGEPNSESDNYYVKFETTDGSSIGRGIWRESIGFSTHTSFDLETMPHILVRESNGTFTFSQGPWADRLVGDEESAPDPSFVGTTINDIFFYRGRLGFLADENEIFSEAAEYFNFWPTTVTTLLDSDPVDVAASHTKVSILKHAVPFAKKLLSFSDQTQFVCDPGDLLTPKTVSIAQTTEFENSDRAKPVGVGRNVFFTVNKGAWTGVREYYVDDQTNVNDAADVTAHVPSFIPANVFKLAAATNEDIMILLTEDERDAIYIYKYFWRGNEKLQSAWGKWTFGSGVKILNADFINTTLVMVVQRQDGVYLEDMSVEPNRADADMDYEVLVDRKITEDDCTSVTYSSTTNKTTWTLPYAESATMLVVTRPGGAKAVGITPTILQPTSTTITAVGDWTSDPVYIGKVYEARYTLSTIVMKNKSETGATPIDIGRLQLLKGKVFYDMSGYFRIEVTPLYGNTYTYVYNGRVIASGNNVLGETILDSGTFEFPIRSKNDRVTIEIVSEKHLPFRIQSAEWEGLFSAVSNQRV